MMLTVRIKNIGAAPSIAERFSMSAKFANGVVQWGELRTIPDTFDFNYPDGSSETISYGDQLDVRAQQPIPQGGQVFGRLFYVFDVDYDTMKNQLAEVNLNFFDAYEAGYSTTGQLTGWRGEARAVPGIKPLFRTGSSPTPTPKR